MILQNQVFLVGFNDLDYQNYLLKVKKKPKYLEIEEKYPKEIGEFIEKWIYEEKMPDCCYNCFFSGKDRYDPNEDAFVCWRNYSRSLGGRPNKVKKSFICDDYKSTTRDSVNRAFHKSKISQVQGITTPNLRAILRKKGYYVSDTIIRSLNFERKLRDKLDALHIEWFPRVLKIIIPFNMRFKIMDAFFRVDNTYYIIEAKLLKQDFSNCDKEQILEYYSLVSSIEEFKNKKFCLILVYPDLDFSTMKKGNLTLTFAPSVNQLRESNLIEFFKITKGLVK